MMSKQVSTNSVRESADRVCRFRPIKGGGFRAALEITRRCNIACLHCFVPNQRQDPDLAVLREIILELGAAGCRKILLTGGEPLLRLDLEQLVRIATDAGIGVDLNSNLVNLSEARVHALVDAGLSEASVSFYGDSKFHNEFVRHREAYESTLRSCELLTRNGVDLDFHGPVWAENLVHLDHLYRLAESVGADSITWFKVIGLAGGNLAGGELAAPYGPTRFGARAEKFHPPDLSELESCVNRLRSSGTIPVRTIGFWKSPTENCEQGCSIFGVNSDLTLTPCLLARRRSPAKQTISGGKISESIADLRQEVASGLWVPVCGMEEFEHETGATTPILPVIQ